MAVEVADLVDLLKANVNPPGANLFPDATGSDWQNNLRNGFWAATLDGLISGYTEAEGVITPTTATDEFPQDLQQLIMLYAAVTIVRNYLMNLPTVFRAQAGPTEFEQQQAPLVLKAILDELIRKRTYLLERLATSETASSSYYYDAAIERDRSLAYRDIYWIGS